MSDTPRKMPRRRHFEALAILTAVVFMAYANCFETGFPMDNTVLILSDARVHSLTGEHIRQILAHGYWWRVFESGLYRPLTTFSYLFNYAILGNGDQPAGYHVVNCLLHAVNGFLVYLLALRFLRQYTPALLIAALWEVHPIATEAVTNIVGRSEELAALGVLSALLLYMRACEQTGPRRTRLLLGVSVGSLVAVFSKESGVTIAALVVLYDWLFQVPRHIPFREKARTLSRWLADRYVFVLVPALFMLYARWVVLRNSGAMEIQFTDNPISGAGFLQGRLTALSVIGRYCWKLIWPNPLSADYSYNQIPLLTWPTATSQEMAAVATVLGLGLIALYACRRSRAACFFVGFSVLTLLPAANLLVITGTIMAERLLYLPSIGFAAALVMGIGALTQRMRLRPAIATGVLAAIGLAFAVRTYARNPDWQSDESLAVSAVETSPNSYKVHLALARAWHAADPTFQEGERPLTEADRAWAIVTPLPNNRQPTDLYLSLGGLYYRRGASLAPKDSDGLPLPSPASEPWFRQAIAADLQGVAVDEAQNENHRRAELARGTPPGRIGLVGMPGIYLNLGYAYLALQEPALASEAFLKERRRSAAAPDAYLHLAVAYQAENRSEDAARSLLEAALLDGSPANLAKLPPLWAKIEGGGCAIAGAGDSARLDRDCPLVKRELCAALRELLSIFQEAGLNGQPWRDAAAQEPDCRLNQ